MSHSVDQPQEILNFLREFSLNPKGFLVLSGMNGTGKSFAARAVYNCISPFELPAFDSDIAIFISQAQLNFRFSEGKEVHRILKEMCHVKLLVLDDIGTRKPSDAFMDFLYAIVDHRFEEREKLATIITTNLTHGDMYDKFGSAFTSRVTSGECFRLEGKDRRDNASLYCFFPLLIDYLQFFGSVDVF
jgi:DNA replication protein DnaC